jgi:Rab-like protein 2
VERFLLDNYKPHQLSTYALTLYRHNYTDEQGTTTPVGECGARKQSLIAA